MLHIRLNGPSRQTAFAPDTRAPTSNATFVVPLDTNVQQPTQVAVQPQPDNPTIDPATGLPIATSPATSPAIDPATGVPMPTTTFASDPRKNSAPPITGYTCSASSCIGTGITDLQFHQLQDLLNKTHQHIRDLSGGTYLGPSIDVNGILDVNTVNSLAAVSASGAVPTLSLYDVHINPQWIADNAASLIKSMQIFVGTYVDPTATLATFYQPSPSTIPPTVQSYTCADGSIVTDPNACPAPSPGTTPGSTPPSIDTTQLQPPSGYVTPAPMPIVIGLSPIGKVAIGVFAILVGAFVVPKLLR